MPRKIPEPNVYVMSPELVKELEKTLGGAELERVCVAAKDGTINILASPGEEIAHTNTTTGESGVFYVPNGDSHMGGNKSIGKEVKQTFPSDTEATVKKLSEDKIVTKARSLGLTLFASSGCIRIDGDVYYW